MNKIVIAGSGIMGASLAQVYAKANYRVTLFDIGEEFLDKGRKLIETNQKIMIEEQMLTNDESTKILNYIDYSIESSCFEDADIVLECIVERLDIKHSFWKNVCERVSDNALLLSNTSGLQISDIAKAVTYPERFAGQHWLNPPHLIPLCEIIRGEHTSDSTVEKLIALANELGKKPVIVQKDVNGFIINRIQFAVLREALNIVESGVATVEDVDRVMKYGLGMRYACLGPFEIADLGGLDTFNSISSYLFADLSDRKEKSILLDELVSNGKLGVKAKAGFYDYSDGKDQKAIENRDEAFIKLAKLLYSEEK